MDRVPRWLAERTGTTLPLTAVTKGTLVSFVTWLDQVKEAAPASFDRRITGVTVTARRPPYGIEVPKEATKAAREALKRLKADRERLARGRGQAVPATPAHLRAMVTASAEMPRAEGPQRRWKAYVLPDLAVYRNRALSLIAFSIAGRAAEVSVLDLPDIVLVDAGLEVHVPEVKGRPARDVEVAYGEHPETCPVLNWLAYKGAAEEGGLGETGPAFRAVDQWGHLGTSPAIVAQLAEVARRVQDGVPPKLKARVFTATADLAALAGWVSLPRWSPPHWLSPGYWSRSSRSV
ncbi:hypothetical protein ACIO3O_37695 [Streptomyces sp. NPDC087440]|uniref:hypothetical protein n=1 Tax=Streptomyces sp. NPDC087440 TaxID=3365790 RepID=UPI0037F4B269